MNSSQHTLPLSRSVRAGLISLLLLLGSLSAQAQNNWTGTTSRDWNTPGNWSGGIPTASSDVVIPSGPANQPILSSTAVANSVEVRTGASLSISSAGSLSVNGSKLIPGSYSTAFYNSGTVVSAGQLVLGNTAAVGQIALWNRSSFTNTATGSITIDRSSNGGLYNELGSFVNSGSVSIGTSATVGFYALLNHSSFTNTAGGSITLDRSSVVGLPNELGNFVNSGSVRVGTLAAVGLYALQNLSSFTNTAGGSITLDRSSQAGLFNESGNFVNSGSVSVGTSAAVGSRALWNRSSFTNTAGGSITLDRSSEIGLYNNSNGSFVNFGGVSIGTSVTGPAIDNLDQATFDNQGCAALLQSLGNGVITNTASFSNTGTIIENATGNSRISFNGGLVQNLNGGTFTIVSGNAAVSGAGLIWTGCTSRDWNTATNWSGGIPTASSNVVIPSAPANQPILNDPATANSVEVQSGASLSISSAGSLTINGSKTVSGVTRGFHNVGTVVNGGALVLGNTASVGQFALWNESSFTNTATGSITIDRSSNVGLANPSGGNFVNSGSVRVGTNAPVGTYALVNRSSFTNTAGGSITIDRSSSTGFLNELGNLVNSGSVRVGTLAAVGLYALQNFSSFTNTAGGSITLDRSSQAGLVNESNSSFVNSGSVSVGTSVTGDAIDNRETFDNQGCAALLQSLGNGVITNTSPGSFSNTGTIIENASGNSGISFNGGLVQNLNGGSFTVASGNAAVSGSGLIWTGCTSRDWNTAGNWSGGIPTASSDVVIPSGPANQPILSTTALANSVEVQSGASLSISNGGSLTINGNKDVSASFVPITTGFYNVGTVVNGGQLVLGSSPTADVGQFGLWNFASFSNVAGGTIQIDRSTDRGLYNFPGSFVNSASIIIGASASVGQTGLYNQSSFSNVAGGSIQIDRSTFSGLYNLLGSFVNSASITIGASASVGQYGLYNLASFSNLVGGSIQIDRATGNGIWNLNSGGRFGNDGKIFIGSVANTAGILNSETSSFSNNAGASIQLDRVPRGLTNRSSTFFNAGQIRMGNNVPLGERGLLNVNEGGTVAAVFNNLAGGLLQIDQTATGQDGITNEVMTTFTNAGTVSIGMSGSIGGNALTNAGTFSNSACATLNIGDNLLNTNSLTNAGFFTVSTTQPHSNTGTLLNNGVISYPQGNPIPNVTNNDLIVNSFSVCGTASTTALQIGGSNSFTVGGTWYKDQALTTAGGTYNQATNTFTPNSLSAGAHTLYLVVTDNTCSQTLTVSVTVQASPTRLYVNASQTAVNGGDGLTWATAFKDLQRALTYTCSQSLTEIWVAGGTYKPTSTTSRTVSFTMLPGVAIYGGLAGTEPNGYNMDLRNFAANPSILSGDIDGVPDVVTGSGFSLTITGNTRNAYHVIYNNDIGLTNTALLDGFTIEAGNANAAAFPDERGGGLFNRNGAPKIVNCIFRRNAATNGGGIYHSQAPMLRLENAQIVSNVAGFGGGIFSFGALSLTRCQINSNFAGNAGGLFLGNQPGTLTNCEIRNNATTFQGSGINLQDCPGATLTNCVVSGNSSQNSQGGIANLTYFGTTSSLTLINSTVANNTSTGGYRAIWTTNGANQTANTYLQNTLVANNPGGNFLQVDNPSSLSFSGTVQSLGNNLDSDGTSGFTNGTNGDLVNVNPVFLSATDVRLSACSPAIDAGNNAATNLTTDLDGNPRKVGTIDIGAFEYQGESVTSFTVLGSGTVTCASSPTITLNGSQTGVTYQLQREGVNTGAAEPGTGAGLSFGPQSVTGIYSVVATNTASSCTLAMAQSATVVSSTALPVASLSAVSLSFCAGSSLTLVASGGINYTFSAGATQAGGSSSNTATVTQSGVYSVTVANASGCINTTTISVTAIPAPSLVHGPAASSMVCVGASVMVPISATGSGNLTYAWYQNGNLVGGQTAATLSLSGVLAGDAGSYSVVVTGACGSVTSTAFSLTVNPIPVVTITPGPGLTISSIQTATFTASGANAFNWSTGANTAAIQVSVAGTYSVTGTTNGCSSTTSVVLSVTSAAPIITTQPPATSSVCEINSVRVTVVVSNSVTSYQWLKNGSPVAGQTSATLVLGNVQPSDAGVYSLSVTGPGGSTTSNGFTLTVNPLPTVTLLVPNNVTVQGPGSGIATITVPANGLPTTFQATGGVLYERLIILDRTNGYEIRQVDSNTTGIFPINRLGLFTLTVTGAGGCKRTVQWVVQQ